MGQKPGPEIASPSAVKGIGRSLARTMRQVRVRYRGACLAERPGPAPQAPVPLPPPPPEPPPNRRSTAPKRARHVPGHETEPRESEPAEREEERSERTAHAPLPPHAARDAQRQGGSGLLEQLGVGQQPP